MHVRIWTETSSVAIGKKILFLFEKVIMNQSFMLRQLYIFYKPTIQWKSQFICLMHISVSIILYYYFRNVLCVDYAQASKMFVALRFFIRFFLKQCSLFDLQYCSTKLLQTFSFVSLYDLGNSQTFRKCNYNSIFSVAVIDFLNNYVTKIQFLFSIN